MRRVPFAGFAGAIVVFSWGLVSWLVTPLHERSVRSLADEDAVRRAIQMQDTESGLYVIPGLPSASSTATAAELEQRMARWLERHREGPLVSIFVQREGDEPMSAPILITGFFINWVSATIAAFVLWLSLGRCQDYLARVGLVTLLGVFAATFCHLSYWNWMWFPLDHTLAMFVDVIVAWIFAGLIIGALIRPTRQPVDLFG
jgi:hypothetical protein